MAKKELSYKDAFTRLQEIQDLIEAGRLDLDELSVVLKEAVGLSKICRDKLFVIDEETQKILQTIP